MSDNKVNNKLDFRNVKTSQFGGSQIERAEFSELQSAKRVFDTTPVLKDAYTHFVQQTNVDGRPTLVEYYQASDPAQDKLQFRADNAGDLAGTYITVQEFLTKRTHVFYCVVSGSGVAPGIGDIETPIVLTNNDPSSVVCYAFKVALSTIEEYIVIQKNLLSSSLDIEYLQFGETQAVDVGTTGFLSTRIKSGSSFKVGEIELDYDVDGSPIYNGSTLKGLLYNPYTASFDVERDEIKVTTQLDTPSTFNVTEISVPNANVEIAINIPDGTQRFKLQAREPNTRMTVTNATSGDYFTVRYGSHYEEEGVKTNGVTLYVTTSRDSRTIELLTWA